MADDFRDDVSSADYAQALELGLSVDQYNTLLDQGGSLFEYERSLTGETPEERQEYAAAQHEAELAAAAADQALAELAVTSDSWTSDLEALLEEPLEEPYAYFDSTIADIIDDVIVEEPPPLSLSEGIGYDPMSSVEEKLTDTYGDYKEPEPEPTALEQAEQEYEESVELATDAASEYLSAREDREALEDELVAWEKGRAIEEYQTGLTYRQDEEIARVQEEIEVAKFVEETALDTAAAAEALKVTASEDLMLADQAAEEQAAWAAEDAAEEALLKEQMEAREEVKTELAMAHVEIINTDIMKGEGITGTGEDIEALQAAVEQAAVVSAIATIAESSESTQKEAEELFLQASEVLGTAKETVSKVKEDLALDVKTVEVFSEILIEELGGEEGIGYDADGNLTTGEKLDTREERDEALEVLEEQLAEIEDLLDPDKAMEFHNDANKDGQIDPGEMAGGLQKDYLDPEAVKLLEEQQEELTKLQQQITDAEKLVGFQDDLYAAEGGHGDPQAKSVQSFWSNTPNYDPKLKFRFKVRIDGMALQDALGTTGADNPGDDHYNDQIIAGDDLVWYAKSVDKPKLTFATIGADFLKMGSLVTALKPRADRPSFGAVSMVLVDPGYPNVTRKLIRWLRRTGYNDSTAEAAMNATYSKSSTDAFLKTIGNVQIEQLDANGFPIEKWTLIDAFPQEIDFGQLDYSSNDLVEIKITWAYKTIKVHFAAHGAEEAFDYFPGSKSSTTMTEAQRLADLRKRMEMDAPPATIPIVENDKDTSDNTDRDDEQP